MERVGEGEREREVWEREREVGERGEVSKVMYTLYLWGILFCE